MPGTIIEATDGQIDELMAVNLKTPRWMAKAAWGKGVRARTICPRLVNIEMAHAISRFRMARRATGLPSPRPSR
ncbi:hypothetical protein [Roseovarius sp. MMSF_3281]|uniref:hypothetical protein n=1 Tax=Roseovarius sp. MMSF_3281 TaxID=3046694 RepID=UPI00273E168F|nr:hypothetical protein [Roseovarius sp. MMSF_3281]